MLISTTKGEYVIKFNLRPLPLALACLLSPVHAALAADAGSSASIPLDLIQENYGGGQYGYRLGINVGVNGATPEEYLFDTGSDSFNIAVGAGNNGQAPAWFPNLPGAKSSAPYAYLYGNGTYGYWQASTTVGSVQFYNATTGAQVAGYSTPQGLPVATILASLATPQSAGGDTLGPQITTQGGVALYQDLTWQQNLNQGNPPDEGNFYGIFGAGDFGNGVTGMLTASGYIVEANGTGKAPGACAQACLIEGLTPALRAQFLSVVPWLATNGQTQPFPLSGAPSAYQFDTAFLFTLTGGGITARAPMMTLFDTGTPNIMLIDNGDLGLASAAQKAGQLDGNGNLLPGITLTANGLTVTANGLVISGQPTSVISGNDSQGDYSNVVTVGPYGGFPDSAIYGLSFFMHNAVMFDLANQATAYTPFFISTADIATGFTVTPAMGPLGLAGTISGGGPLQVAAGGIADLSGSNTYTGATVVANGGWLALAGPGSIAQSADVHVDGIFDISRTWQATTLQSLSGAGLVQLGGTTLDLTHANGNYTGQIADGGIGGGVGGRLIVSAGTEVLSGHNSFTGATGVGAPATLDVEGSLASGVVNLGQLIVNGKVGGNVANAGLLVGQGSLGGSLANSGTVAPGNGGGQYSTLHVGGNYSQGAGAVYLAQINIAQPGVASLIAVDGSATLAPGALLALAPVAGSAPYLTGSSYTVLDAAKGVSGSYALAGPAMVSAVLGLAPAYDAQHVYLDVVQTRGLADAALTLDQRNTLAGAQSQLAGATGMGQPAGAGIRPLDWNVAALPMAANAPAVYTVLANLPTDAALRAAADQLSGAIHASAQGVLLENSRYVRDAVAARLRQAGGGGAKAGGPAVEDGKGDLAWWGQFVGSWGHHSSDGNAATLRDTTGGLLLGADHALGGKGRIGVMAGYTHTAVNSPAAASSASSRDLDLSVYTGVQLGALGLRAGVAHAWHRLDGQRFIAVPGLVGNELSRYDADTSQAFGEAGYRFAFKRATLEPFAQAAWVRLHTDGFQEHGGLADLSASSASRSLGYSTLGARVSGDFVMHDGQPLGMHAMLGWRRAYGRIDTASTLAFAGGSPFAVQGLPMARNAAVADAGFTLQLAPHASLDLSWQGQFATHVADSGFRGSFDWQF